MHALYWKEKLLFSLNAQHKTTQHDTILRPMNNTQQNGQLCNDTDVKGQQQHPIRNKWFSEAMNADWYNLLSLKRIEYSGRTQFQDMDIMELGCFGRSLVLDNRLQSCENDECVYHESLVHPVMLSAPTKPKSVFVGGGGEGATGMC